jgi:hypothetical protein
MEKYWYRVTYKKNNKFLTAFFFDGEDAKVFATGNFTSWTIVYEECGLSQPPSAEALRDVARDGSMRTLYRELNERLSFLHGQELSDSVMAQRAEVALCIVRVQQLLLGDVDSSQPAARGLSRDAGVDEKYLPIDGRTGLELSWEETARNFMEDNGRLRKENEGLRELADLQFKKADFFAGISGKQVDAEMVAYGTKLRDRILELRSLLSLDGSVDQPASREAIRDAH